MNMHAPFRNGYKAVSHRRQRPREESDNFPFIVTRISPSWRVISDADRLQWIVQAQRGTRHGAPIWRNLAFCSTRAALLRCVDERVGHISSTALMILRILPPHIRETQ